MLERCFVCVFCHPPWQRENSCLLEQNDRHEKSFKKIAVRWEQESLPIPLSFCVWTPTHETKKRQSKNISEWDPSIDYFLKSFKFSGKLLKNEGRTSANAHYRTCHLCTVNLTYQNSWG